MSGESPKLLPETDYLLDQDKAAMGTVLTAFRGGDPLYDPPATGYPRFIETEVARRAPLMRERTRQMNEGLFLNPDSGWGQIKQFMDGVFDSYKKQNDSPSIKKPKNEQEALAQMQQMRPVQVDPNEVANIRQLATKFAAMGKKIDPSFDPWKDPRTKGYFQWLNREAGQGTSGFMKSGDQPVEMGTVGRAAYGAWQGIEGVGSSTTALVHGLWDLGRQSITAMGGPDIGPSYPTNYIETEDGQLVANGGKAPSMLDGITMMWAQATSQNVEKYAASVGRAQEWELANRAGLAGLTTSVSRLGGEIVGMAPGFGAAAKVGEMTLGKLTQKGLQNLGALRLAKTVGVGEERGLKIIGAMSKGMGQASGMAAYESITQGRVEGYGAAYLHGLMMAPVLMTLGALGKKTEWYAANRVGMPGAAARAVAGALEGAGFGAVETMLPELLPSAWGFVRDPNQSTWEAYAKNMLAFSLVKMTTGHTAIASPEQMQIKRGIGRSQFAEKVAQGRATPEEIAKTPVPNESKLRELGEVSMLSREAKTPAERTAATTRQREIEREMDAEEFGQKPPAQEDVDRYLETPESVERGTQRLAGMPKKIGSYDFEVKPFEDVHREAGLGTHEWTVKDPETGRLVGAGTIRSDGRQVKIEDATVKEEYRGKGIYSTIVKSLADLHGGRITSRTQSEDAKKAWRRAGVEQFGAEKQMPTVEQVQAVREMPDGPEKRERTLAMLRGANEAFARVSAKSLAEVSKLELEKQVRELDAAQQLVEAGEIQQAMVKGLDVGAIKSARKRAQAELQMREQVPGKEPQPMRTVADKPAPEKQLVQEGGREGLDPERYVADDTGAAAKREERRVLSSRDPLEDPRFRELDPALQDEILAAPDADVRKQLFAERVRERRVSVDVDRGTSKASMLDVRRPAQQGQAELLPDVPREGDAGVAQDPQAHRRAAPEGQRAELRARLPQEGEAGEAAVRGVRGEGADAPRRLPEADEGALALPGASSGAARGELEARQGDRMSPSGARQGPQSLQQQPHRQLEPEPGVQQVSAKDIFAEMGGRPGRKGFRIPGFAKRIFGKSADVVRVAIGAGKVAGRSTLGVFRYFENLMRTQEGRDLAVGSHEFSHAMHRHTISDGGGKAFIKATKDQVKAALAGHDGPAIYAEMKETLKDYPGSENMPLWLQWMETWAEWHARNLLGEVGLDAKLPALSSYMRSWLAEPAQASMRGQYDRIQQMLYRYNAQGAEGRLRQSRVSGAAAPTETEKAMRPNVVRRAFDAFNKAFFDDMADLKSSQDKWLEAAGRRPEDVSITEDPARMFDTLKMTSDKTVEYFVNRGFRKPGGGHTPGLKSIMESVKGRTEEFQDFVVAMRSMELYKKGKTVTLPVQDYVHNIERLTLKNPDFVDQLSNLKQWTDSLVDYVVGSGNISAEDGKRIKDAYVVYVPFFRAVDGPAQHGQGRGTAERGTGLSHIKGSTFEVKDPFIALQQVARSMVAKAHQNQVMTALFKMSVGQEAGGLASIVKRTNVPQDHPLRRLLDAIEAKVQLPGDLQHDLESVFDALRTADALNPETITTFTQKVIPTGERNIIAYTPRLSEMEIADLVAQGAHRPTLEAANNKLQWLETDTKVYEALMGIDKMPQLPEKFQPVMQWLQAPRDLVRFFATGVAPGFVAANLVRDAMSAPIFDRQGKFRPFGGFVKLIRGAIEYHKNGEMRELYEELGVKTSSFWTEGRQRALIGEEVSLWQKAKAKADAVQNWFSHPENYIRMAEFKDAYEAAKKAGKSEIEARMEALEGGREITVNFARAGIWARVMNQTIPYFNAGLQGQRKLWGQLIAGGADTKGDENKARVQRGAILNGIANLTVPATLLWLLNKDEEWYQDLPEWRKIGYFNMKIGGEIVSVPKPFEAGVLFASLPEVMLDRTFGQNAASTKEAMKSLVGPYLELGTVIPSFIKPILEVTTNYNLFTGRPLTPEWIARSNPSQEQATFYTTETAKVMSKALGGILSPIEIEALSGGYTAGAATKAMKVLDEIAGLKDHPGIAMNPFQRFSSQQEHGQSSFVDQLYSLGAKLEQNEDTLDASGNALKRNVENAKRQISDLRKRYRAGEISQAEAERRSYELARPIVEQQRNR